MKKNVASQSIGAQMITASDGSDFTGAVSVEVTIDNGTQTSGGGTAPAHEGNGYHSYTPTQAETNGDHVAFTFTGTGAITATAQVFTAFPQTGDNYVRLGAPADTDVSTDILNLQNSVNNIGGGAGGSVNFEAIEDNTGGAIIDSVTFVGNVTSGTFANTQSNDGSSHSFSDTGNVIDVVYGFSVGGGRIGTSVNIIANVNGNADEMVVQIYDHIGGDWETVGTIAGTGGTSPVSIEPPIFQKHTGTGAEIGNVYVRFNTLTTTPSTLDVDLCVVSGVNIGQSIGYANGAVWLDTNASNTSTESFVDGVADNPVSTIAAALTVAGNVGIRRISVAAGSSFTMAADFSNYEIMGNNYTIALGGQTITGAKITGATVSGTYVGTTAILEGCIINAITGPGTTLRRCFFNEVTITNNGTSDWYMNDCRSRVAGTGRPTFDFGAGTGSTGVSLRAYSGGIEIENMGDSGTDTLSMEGDGAITINANCDGGTAAIRGNIRVTDNSGGNVTLQITPDVTGYVSGSVWVDETSGTSSGDVVGVDATFQNQADDFDNAQTVADALGASTITIRPGNSVTLSAALQSYTINNVQATLNGGSQNVDSTRFNGGFLAGTFSRAGTGVPTFSNCNLNNITSDRVACINNCGILGTFTLAEAGVYVFNDAQAAGATSIATLDFDSIGGATVFMQRWSGDLTVNNLASGDTIRVHCASGGDIILNGADATVEITGTVGTVTNNLTGSPTVSDNSITTPPTAVQNRQEMDSNSTQLAAILADTNELQTDDVPGLIAALNDISVLDILTTQMAETYAADGVAPTIEQALMLIQQALTEFSYAGTSNTVKRLDGSTTAAEMTLDDGTNPTSSTRTS